MVTSKTWCWEPAYHSFATLAIRLLNLSVNQGFTQEMARAHTRDVRWSAFLNYVKTDPPDKTKPPGLTCPGGLVLLMHARVTGALFAPVTDERA
jgi:hypothetical protein